MLEGLHKKFCSFFKANVLAAMHDELIFLKSIRHDYALGYASE